MAAAPPDAIRVSPLNEGMVRNKSAHIAPGGRMNAPKEIVGLWLKQNEAAKFQLRVMNELRNRGVENVPLAVVDGLKGVLSDGSRALKATYHAPERRRGGPHCQICETHNDSWCFKGRS